MNRLFSLTVIATLALPLSLAEASTPDGPPAGHGARPPEPPFARDRERDTARERIETRLREARAEVDRHERALEMLEGGASLDEIRTMLEEEAIPSPSDLAPDEIMAVLADVNPRLHAGLAEKRDDRPDAFRLAMRRIAPHVVELAHLRETDRDEYEARVERTRNNQQIRFTAFRIAAAEKRGDEQRVESLTSELESLITRQFELAIEEKRRQMGAIESRLADARHEIERLAERREQVIAGRVDEVLQRARQAAERMPDRPWPKRERDRSGSEG